MTIPIRWIGVGVDKVTVSDDGDIFRRIDFENGIKETYRWIQGEIEGLKDI